MRTVRCISLTPLLFTTLLAQAPLAQAAPPAASTTDPTDADISRIYDKGLRAAERKQWDKARQAFQEAWDARKHYQIAANLGRTELMTGAYRDAAEHLAFFLREAPAEITAKDRAKAEAMLNEARAKVGTITLRVEPAGAEVLVNGAAVDAPPGGEVYVDPGLQVVEARQEGHVPAHFEMQLDAGQREIVELRLRPVPKPAPALPPSPPPEPEEGRSMALIGAGIGVSAAAAVTGGVLLAIAVTKISQRDAICDAAAAELCPLDRRSSEEWLDLERQRATLLNASAWSFIGAGAVGAATLVYALTGGGPGGRVERMGKVQVHPMGAGVAVTGRW